MSSLQTILSELGPVKLVAVSKTHPPESIQQLYNEGQRCFGENKVQELLSKYEHLPKDIEWHMIGHLQSNKVKYIAPFVSLIQSVDSLKLLFEIDKQAARCSRKINVLLQMHIAQEETKFGLDTKELTEILEYYTADPSPLRHVTIIGLMGMATLTNDTKQIEKEFTHLKNLFQQTKDTYLMHKPEFTEISMGMSSDYRMAKACGSTMVRIGSLLFGSR